MGVSFRGFREFIRAFSPGHARRRLAEEQVRRMRRAVLLLRTDILKYIASAEHGVPNAPLTALIKGSTLPLVDRGDLRLGIETDVSNGRRGVVGAVGVTRSRRTKDGKKLFSVAAALHEGFVIRVTPAVRAAVLAKLRERRGGALPPGGGSGSTTWKVRGRPFIREPLTRSERRIIDELGAGVVTTLKGL